MEWVTDLKFGLGFDIFWNFGHGLGQGHYSGHGHEFGWGVFENLGHGCPPISGTSKILLSERYTTNSWS